MNGWLLTAVIFFGLVGSFLAGVGICLFALKEVIKEMGHIDG